jgi:hypothetical protein
MQNRDGRHRIAVVARDDRKIKKSALMQNRNERHRIAVNARDDRKIK